MDTDRLLKSGIWLFLGTSIASLVGYSYWILIAGFVSPKIVGSIAAIIALHSILEIAFALGIPAGLQRFVGISRGLNDYEKISSYFFTGLGVLVVLNGPILILIVVTSSLGVELFGLAPNELFIVACLLLASFWTSHLNSLFISLLRTKVSAIVQIVSAISKVIVGISLLSLGFGFIGAVSGFLAYYISMDLLFLVYLDRLTNVRKTRTIFNTSHCKDLVRAGSAAWFPRLVTALGDNVGVLLVFGVVGSSETGFYYIAFAIGSIVYSFPRSLLAVMYPFLSSLDRGQEEAIARAIRLSLAFTAPIAILMVSYSNLPFLFLGVQYVGASDILAVIVIGAIVFPIVSGYFSYTYATGRYRHVAAVDLATNVARLALYVLLVPVLSGLGAAIAYSSGIFVGLLAVGVSAYLIGFRLRLGLYLRTIAIPIFAGLLILILDIGWFVGVPFLLALSLLAYCRLGIITRTDLQEIGESFMSKDTIDKMYSYFRPVFKLMFGGIE